MKIRKWISACGIKRCLVKIEITTGSIETVEVALIDETGRLCGSIVPPLAWSGPISAGTLTVCTRRTRRTQITAVPRRPSASMIVE